MWRANTGQAARHNPATLGDKLREQPVILVIDGLNLLHAKLANLLAPEIFAATFAAPGPSRAASTRWTPLAAVSALGSLSAAFSAGCCRSSFVSHDAPYTQVPELRASS